MSPKQCSLALDVEEDTSIAIESGLRLVVDRQQGIRDSSAVRLTSSDVLEIRGSITVSF